eukprot:CAMPEP_0194144514 /NCGR_PEP_ID=MMETSP0152-20130528/13562_1 /TAXON_ID=1049557 /ORGANISM="Thalassiothrix antarctica, Strain L6-D1" /LENGTH=203 /DNA_ID=CAMNT_0038844403 /DNA_START=57 /DNA_END=668 /DNA_ORIENTATION=+
MTITSLIFCVFAFISLLAINKILGVSTDNDNSNRRRRHLRGFSIKNRSIEARQALSNAILSSVRSSSGDFEEKALDEAIDFGFGRQQVRYMSRLALKQKKADGGSIERIEKDMERLVSPDMAFPISEDEEEEVDGTVYDYNYRPKGSWHTSQETHVLVSTAILTAIRSPTSEVDPKALEDAIAAGVSREEMKKYIDAAIKPKR